MTEQTPPSAELTVEFIASPIDRAMAEAESQPPVRAWNPGWTRALTIAATAPALVLPLPWIALTALVRFLIEARARMSSDGDFASAPAAAGHTLTSFFSMVGRSIATGRILVWALKLILALVAGAVVGGLCGALLWLITYGTAGAPAAGRSAAFAFATGLAAWYACTKILQVQKGRAQPASTEAPPAAQVAAVFGVAALALAVTLSSTPRTWSPWSDGRSATQALPAGLAGLTNDLHHARADNAVEAVSDCAFEDSAARYWQWGVTEPANDGSMAATVQVTEGPPASRGDLAVLAVALQNALPSSVTEVTLQRRRSLPPFTFSREGLRRSWQPFRDSAAIAAAGGVEPRFLPMSPESRARALACSAKAP